MPLWLWLKFIAESRNYAARYTGYTIKVHGFTLSPRQVGYVSWQILIPGEEYPKNCTSMIPRGA